MYWMFAVSKDMARDGKCACVGDVGGELCRESQLLLGDGNLTLSFR